ncbi:ATP-binding protein [Tunicatimonas pelagia]|uniref:ATP-binding protein n=1 Tax=Tunicatimonas pelagia TaxID=931531 RepID=UPI002666506A|nr:ATP-binding protein [Tunicatimonas pelagia]WKN43388.1 ATP-binding protein [Tunicatimonas pelagia]
MKDLKPSGNNDKIDNYVQSNHQHIEIGLLKNLSDRVKLIEESNQPNHIFLIGEYGQGKSFSLKVIQDKIYVEYNGGIICYTLGLASSTYRKDTSIFEKQLMEDIEKLFDRIDPDLYTSKPDLIAKYNLKNEKNFRQFLQDFDQAFKELDILVYVFIDELDKIVISEIDENGKRKFLETIKTIADVCSTSISLIVAGTPNCEATIDELSDDYKQRFYVIEKSSLAIEDLKKYIREKFRKKLRYVGHYPFHNSIYKKLLNITGGNIRKVESVSRDLWNLSAERKCKINNSLMKDYLLGRLREKINSLLVKSDIEVTENKIRFIFNLFFLGGKVGINKVEKSLTLPKKREIRQLISSNNLARIVDKSYVLDGDTIDSLKDSLVV